MLDKTHQFRECAPLLLTMPSDGTFDPTNPLCWLLLVKLCYLLLPVQLAFPYIFRPQSHSGRLLKDCGYQSSSLLKRFKVNVAAAGLDAAVTLHSIRRGLAIELDTSGIAAGEAMQVLGMASERTFGRYADCAAPTNRPRLGPH
jgi:hypothetical protein